MFVSVCLCVSLYELMHGHTVGDIDPKPSQGGAGGPISGHRGGVDPGGGPPPAPGVPKGVGQYTKCPKEAR